MVNKMKVICVDDEKIILAGIVANCKKISMIDEVVSFNTAEELIEYLEYETADIIFSDINMPDMNGIELANWLKKNKPEINLVFTTGYSEYANQAIRANAKGYLMKPIRKADIEEQIGYFIEEEKNLKRIEFTTFGNFDVKVDGKPLALSSKTKEALAYLVDRNGSAVTRKELASILYEDDDYSRTVQSYLTKIFAELKKVFDSINLSDFILFDHNTYSINTEMCICDSYEFLKGTPKYQNSYHGEYMMQYSWGDTELYRFEEDSY